MDPVKTNIRGEVTAAICGKERTLKPSILALCEVEDQLGTSLVVLADRATKRDFRLRDMATVIAAGCKASGEAKPPTWQEVGEWILATGMVQVIPLYAGFLMPMLVAGPGAGTMGEAPAAEAAP